MKKLLLLLSWLLIGCSSDVAFSQNYSIPVGIYTYSHQSYPTTPDSIETALETIHPLRVIESNGRTAVLYDSHFSFVYSEEGVFLTSHFGAIRPDSVKQRLIFKLNMKTDDQWKDMPGATYSQTYRKIASDSTIQLGKQKMVCDVVEGYGKNEFGLLERAVYFLSRDLKLLKYLFYSEGQLYFSYELVKYTVSDVITQNLISVSTAAQSNNDSLVFNLTFDDKIRSYYIGGDYFSPIMRLDQPQKSFTLGARESYDVWVFGFGQSGQVVDLLHIEK